ncbi:MAG TPA: DUF2500 domain-containing protein [Clostridia bacterium]|nr:DUF2500 domain-containing protein [Clostridia bacterium]
MMFDPFDGGGFMFTVIPALVAIGFVTILGIIIFQVVKGAQRWKRNNDSPVLTTDARVVTKRADVSYHHHMNNMNDSNNTMNMGYSSTSYFVTFEVPSGDRMELPVQSDEYGLLVEGDAGKLTFQGTRYLGFTRVK